MPHSVKRSGALHFKKIIEIQRIKLTAINEAIIE